MAILQNKTAKPEVTIIVNDPSTDKITRNGGRSIVKAALIVFSGSDAVRYFSTLQGTFGC